MRRGWVHRGLVLLGLLLLFQGWAQEVKMVRMGLGQAVEQDGLCIAWEGLTLEQTVGPAGQVVSLQLRLVVAGKTQTWSLSLPVLYQPYLQTLPPEAALGFAGVNLLLVAADFEGYASGWAWIELVLTHHPSPQQARAFFWLHQALVERICQHRVLQDLERFRAMRQLAGMEGPPGGPRELVLAWMDRMNRDLAESWAQGFARHRRQGQLVRGVYQAFLDLELNPQWMVERCGACAGLEGIPNLASAVNDVILGL